jgi:hypothetical protein
MATLRDPIQDIGIGGHDEVPGNAYGAASDIKFAQWRSNHELAKQG